ncbi:hypothetical protein PHYPO_G00230920 [Pangasianodon hypophthalmus]|uniref:Uncharacterized protein n=1 Tax=Pangasianodon hypophthalmus TaxID=310915 RepID=A0A5N5NLY6_PANHP|nr:hypothetical protein PHYPO_G00230920 [Pangasianodon hypophthalmus]
MRRELQTRLWLTSCHPTHKAFLTIYRYIYKQAMRTIQAANHLIRKQAWDRKTRWTWNRPEEDPEVQDGHFKQLDSAKEGSHSAYRFAPVTLNGTSRPLGKHSSKAQDFLLKPRQVVLQNTQEDKTKEGDVNALITSKSLPPICGSRVRSVRGAKSCSSSQPALQTDKKAGVSSNGARSVRTLICRQKERAQLTSTVDMICRSLAPFRVTECTQDSESPPLRRGEKKRAWMKPSVTTHTHSSRHLGFEKKNLSSNDSGVITERIKDSVSMFETNRHSQPLSDSAIETGTQSSHRKRGEERNRGMEDEEEVYYTTKMIAEWIIRVNASLFSPFKDELNKTHLKEEDVDTIKIIYGQD